MPISAILSLMKILAPVFLAAGLVFSGYYWKSADCAEEAYQKQLELDVAAQQLKNQAIQANAKLTAVIETAKQQIETTNDENTKLVDAITVRNRALLAQRVRDAKAGGDCHRMPETSAAAEIGTDAGITGTWVFLSGTGEGIVQAAEQADDLTESLRACRGYVATVTKASQ